MTAMEAMEIGVSTFKERKASGLFLFYYFFFWHLALSSQYWVHVNPMKNILSQP
jgi:hypothetical protein